MTDPNKYAFRMLLLLLIVMLLIGFLFEPLKQAFEGNSEDAVITNLFYWNNINFFFKHLG